MFDSIINEAQERLGLGDKAGSIVTALLGLIANPAAGGFGGFLDKFRNAGMSDEVNSWVGGGDNTPISGEQAEAALGAETIGKVAEQSGVEPSTVASAIGFLTPRVVNTLTPEGSMPDEAGLMSKLTGFLRGVGGIGGTAAAAVAGGIGAVSAFAGGASDKVGDAAGATLDAGKAVAGKGVDLVGGAAGASLDAGKAAAAVIGGKVTGTMNNIGIDTGGGGSSILKWVLPLLLLGVLVGIGWWVLRPGSQVASTSNTNAVKPPVASPTTAAAVPAAVTDGERKLTEMTLPNGTKIQAFPGGIEDQLVKFLQSDEYKNGTAETLKDKWFNFDDLSFKVGSSELAPESKRQVDNLMAILKAFPDVKMKIGGYTDKTGDDAKNKKLSDDRAKAVKSALDKAGVGAQVPEAEGYGEQFAKVAETASDQERKADRKTSVRVLK